MALVCCNAGLELVMDTTGSGVIILSTRCLVLASDRVGVGQGGQGRPLWGTKPVFPDMGCMRELTQRE